MVTTDLDLEFRKILRTEHLTRKNICDIFEITSGNLSRLLHKELPTQQLVRIMDVIGYDTCIVFKKKEKTATLDEVLEAIKNECGKREVD